VGWGSSLTVPCLFGVEVMRGERRLAAAAGGNKSGRPGGFLTNFSRFFFKIFRGTCPLADRLVARYFCAWLGSLPLVCGLDVWVGSLLCGVGAASASRWTTPSQLSADRPWSSFIDHWRLC
jgi:hypothetical protein